MNKEQFDFVALSCQLPMREGNLRSGGFFFGKKKGGEGMMAG